MNEQETIADIIAEKRALADRLEHEMAVAKECKELTAHRTAQAIIDSTRREADRIDAAHKREVDALKHEVAEKDADIADLKSRVKLWTDRADELRKKCDEFYAKSKAAGDCAKLRVALCEILSYIESFHKYIIPGKREKTTALFAVADTILGKARAALAAPPRNCDRPECATTKAAQDVWRKEDGGNDGK